MSDISTITLDGVTYNLKDKVARQQIDALDDRVETTEEDIRSLVAAVGTPLVATTAAAMTDHTKIYVYTGSETGYNTGHWYYWDGSAWSDGGVYNSTAFETDKTLTVSDAAADAKVVGDEFDNLKTALNKETNAVSSNFIGGDYFPYFIQGNTTKITGTDYLQNGFVHSDSVSTDIKAPVMLNAGDVITINSGYTFRHLMRVKIDEIGTLWLEGVSSPTSPYTVETTGLYVMVIKTEPAGGRLTPADVEGKIKITTQGVSASIQDIYGEFSSINEKEEKEYQSLICSIGQGKYSPYLVQGSVSRITGTDYLQNGLVQAERVSTNVKNPVFLAAGDTVTVDSNFAIQYLMRVELDENGTLLLEMLTTPASPCIVQTSGLYVMVIKPSISGTHISPSDLDGKIFISNNGGVNEENIGYGRLKDPYTDIDWSVTQVVTSCHAHCTTDRNLENLINAGYTALIPTNYRPSKPWYPPVKFYPGVTDVANYLSAPNCEVSGFNFGRDAVNPRQSHVSPLGSFLAVGTASSATYGNGFDDFARLARQTRKGFSQGGIIINHPNWSGNNATEICKVLKKYPDVLGIEIYNFTCEDIYSNGYALDIFDEILSLGIQCFGFASPDHGLEGNISDFTKPFGFINVLASCPTDEALLAAIASGAFYSTLYNDGLKITKIGLSGTTYSVEAEANGNISIKFITASRDSTVSSSSATFTVDPTTDIYVRAEISCGNNKAYTNAIMLV